MMLRTYPTLESCKEACWRSNLHRTPIKLKNGRWAAMTWNEQLEYERKYKPAVATGKPTHSVRVAEQPSTRDRRLP